jgi:hypothetical protein
VARASGPGEGYHKNFFNILSFLYPSPAAHLVMGGTLSLQERDSKTHSLNLGSWRY